MKVLQNIEGFVQKEPESSILVTRLERNQKDVNQLRAKLDAYNCEPQTYRLFERKEALKSGLESLNRTNGKIMASLKEKEHGKSVKEYAERVKQQFSEYLRLQQGVEEYMRSIHHYSGKAQ